jgi:SAM-dependent methyltransferase
MTTTDSRSVDAPAVDEAAVEHFVGRALGDLAGTMAVLLASIGDRVGLFHALADGEPRTTDQVAAAAGTHPRYTREWLAGMTAAGYLRHEPAGDTFTLPAEHAPVLAQEDGPVFFGGVWEELTGTLPQLEAVATAFRTGGGVPPDRYGPQFWRGIERFSGTWFANQLIPVWLPAVPAVQALLERGCDVADVGCGAGRALITLAHAFPRSRYVGYDAVTANIDRARRQAAEAGVADRVRFAVHDVTTGLPEPADVVVTFDVVHDAADPAGLLRAIRQALRPGGRYLCLDINAADRLEDNVGPLGALFYGFSVLYCMTSSLAQCGAGLGTCGFTESVATELGRQAGFSHFGRVPLDNPFNILYEAEP